MFRFDVEAFIDGYAGAVLYTETDQMDDSGGEPLDKNYDLSDFSDDAMVQIRLDCTQFIQSCAVDLFEAVNRPGYTSERAGYDFWVTRQESGVGFSDRDELESEGLGERLHALAEAYGRHYDGPWLENDQVHYGDAKPLPLPEVVVAPAPVVVAPASRRPRGP